MLTLQKK